MSNSNIYAGYRYPAQIISHAVWLYHCFTLSFEISKNYSQHAVEQDGGEIDILVQKRKNKKSSYAIL